MMRRRALSFGTAMAMAALTLGACELLPVPLVKQLPQAQPLPDNRGGTTYLNMGRQLLGANQPEMAQDAFIRSIRIEGVTAEALNGAGLASEQLGLLHDAKRYFERATKIAPNSVTAQNNLGAVLYRLGEYHAAKRAFQAAFALSSGSSTVAEQNVGLANQAIRREAEQGLALSPNPVPLQRRGTGEYILGTPTVTEQDG